MMELATFVSIGGSNRSYHCVSFFRCTASRQIVAKGFSLSLALRYLFLTFLIPKPNRKFEPTPCSDPGPSLIYDFRTGKFILSKFVFWTCCPLAAFTIPSNQS